MQQRLRDAVTIELAVELGERLGGAGRVGQDIVVRQAQPGADEKTGAEPDNPPFLLRGDTRDRPGGALTAGQEVDALRLVAGPERPAW